MKKSLLFGIALFSAAGAFAQQAGLTGNEDVPSAEIRKHFHKGNSGERVNIISDWYNYGGTMYDMGGNVSYFRNFLFPDSTVLVEFTTGYGPVWKHSIGQAFDPTSLNYTIGGQTHCPSTVPYTLDSIAIPYRYWRSQQAAADTLIIQIYDHSDMTLVANPGWTSGASYASVDYDYTKRKGTNFLQEYKYILTNADTISTTQGIIYYQVNHSLAANEKVAATVTYIPGNPYNVNDTIDRYSATPVTNKINAFVFYNYRDNDLNYEPNYYNNELAAVTDVRYNTSTNGWNGNYIPGTAWSGGIYHGDIYFKITFDQDAAAIDENAKENNIMVYPNPAQNVVNFTTDQKITSVNIMDITGKVVETLSNIQVNTIDIAHLQNGFYFLQFTNENNIVGKAGFVKN